MRASFLLAWESSWWRTADLHFKTPKRACDIILMFFTSIKYLIWFHSISGSDRCRRSPSDDVRSSPSPSSSAAASPPPSSGPTGFPPCPCVTSSPLSLPGFRCIRHGRLEPDSAGTGRLMSPPTSHPLHFVHPFSKPLPTYAQHRLSEFPGGSIFAFSKLTWASFQTAFRKHFLNTNTTQTHCENVLKCVKVFKKYRLKSITKMGNGQFYLCPSELLSLTLVLGSVKWPRASIHLRRHRFINIGIPIINLRRSSDRLRFLMGIPFPVRRRLLVIRHQLRPWWIWRTRDQCVDFFFCKSLSPTAPLAVYEFIYHMGNACIICKIRRSNVYLTFRRMIKSI